MENKETNNILEEEKSEKKIIVLLLITTILMITILIIVLIKPANDNSTSKTSTTQTTNAIADTGKIISRPKDNDNGTYLLEVKEDEEGTLITGEYTYTLNDSYKVLVKVLEEGMENGSYNIYVNDKLLIENDHGLDEGIKLHVFGESLVYLNTGYTYVYGQNLYVYSENKVNEIKELDSIKGMWPLEIEVNKTNIKIVGNRIDSNCINYGEALAESEDACVSDKTSWSKYNITDDTIVKAEYTYNFKNNKLELVPVISNEMTLKNYISNYLINEE